ETLNIAISWQWRAARERCENGVGSCLKYLEPHVIVVRRLRAMVGHLDHVRFAWWPGGRCNNRLPSTVRVTRFLKIRSQESPNTIDLDPQYYRYLIWSLCHWTFLRHEGAQRRRKLLQCKRECTRRWTQGMNCP